MTDASVFQFDSIGSRFWLERLGGGDFSPTIKYAITQYCNEFDDSYSRFKDDSLVSQLADTGVLDNPPQELLDMLDFSKRMYDESNGAFNITVGAALHKLGYGSHVYSGDVVVNPWQQITWDEQQVVSPKGLMLDFGGFGKGWMVDSISDILRNHGVKWFIVNGGGDLYVQNDTPIDFALEDPQNPGTALRGIRIQKGALAGSDTIKRTWQSNGVTKHHIIDPATQDSSSGSVIASYVIADTALMADTMATIMILRPDLKNKLETAYGFSSILITKL